MHSRKGAAARCAIRTDGCSTCPPQAHPLAAAGAPAGPTLWRLLCQADDHYTMQDEDLSAPRRIEFCTGSFMAVRTDVFKEIGGFDPAYFMYVEDADLTQKVLQKAPSGWPRSFPPSTHGTAPRCAMQASSRCSLSAWGGISKSGAAGKARFDTSIAKQMKIVQPPVFAGGCSFFARLL